MGRISPGGEKERGGQGGTNLEDDQIAVLRAQAVRLDDELRRLEEPVQLPVESFRRVVSAALYLGLHTASRQRGEGGEEGKGGDARRCC